MEYKTIAKEIIEMSKADLRFRQELIERGELGKSYNAEMEQIHNKNADRLYQIIHKIGYPTSKMLGKEAAEAAWLIIQHSISKPAFMKACAKKLAIAVKKEEARPILLAYLTDRIASFEDRPQLYGTAFDWDKNGLLNPMPFDDLTKVNQRRAALGLNTLEEQIEIIRAQAKEESQLPPEDFEKRQIEMTQWKKKVGWI